MTTIPFNVPFSDFSDEQILLTLKNNKKYCGDGPITKELCSLFEKKFSAKKVLLTTSCTHSLEMSAILLKIKEGDEIIMPSYTFVSTANAFVLRGAKIIFVDIRPDTMNIDENLIEAAITSKTKAIVPVHYAGVACEMDKINSIAKKYNITVVEDAAQGVMSKYKGISLGTIGDLGCYSFHETKNYHCGEGGALVINNQNWIERAEIIREKGTDRSKFLRGAIDKYTWVDIGSSYLLSDIHSAFLLEQMKIADKINESRISMWDKYFTLLSDLKIAGKIELPFIPDHCEHNAHMFYIKLRDIKERSALIDMLKTNNVSSVFHYIPLHSSPGGINYSRFHGMDNFTTIESERLLRLPLFYDLDYSMVERVSRVIHDFFS